MDEDKDSKQNLDLQSNLMRRKSLTEQRNTFAGGISPLANPDVFNPPIKYMASGFNSLHAGIFSMLFVIC